MKESNPEPSGDELAHGLIAELRSIEDPMDRIVAADFIAKQLLPQVFEVMMQSASEFREAGGTWTQISKTMGVTPQAARSRLHPAARVANADAARARRRRTSDSDS